MVMIGLVAVIGLGVTGCGDDDDGSSAPTEETTPDESSSSEASGESLELFLLPTEVGDDCSVVTSVEREAPDGTDVEAALALLLAGPTSEDEASGLSSWFSSETEGMLNGVTVEDGVAQVDFADFSGIIPNASSSCGSTSLLAQLDNTVLQFPDVDDAVYSFDGDRDAFYEWLQRSAPE